MRQWWRDAVVYEVYVRSFADSTGDGVGDLEGIRARVPYLAALGVDALWLTPFYPSPMADHGYDVADPTDVDPLFGDLAAFDALLADAHAAGLKVLCDVVPNHVSVEHAWFREALADPSSPMRERFLFRPGRDGGPPNDWQSVFGGPAWTQTPDGAWYLHLFDSGQPDLDWTRPEVHDEAERVLRFWLDRGVDGFRIDVAHGLYKAEGLPDQGPTGTHDTYDALQQPMAWDRPEVVEVYERWRRVTDSYDGDRVMVGEVFLLDPARVARYVEPGRLHQAFNFSVMAQPFDGPRLRAVVEQGLLFPTPTWVLSNHDLVRHVTRYGGGDLGRRRGLAVTALLLALPGAPYLYAGEELGLEESDVPDDARQDPVFLRTGGAIAGRDGCRTPLPWTAEPPGHGFTTGTPWLPFGTDASARAVDRQEGDPGSVLAVYRRLLARRRELRGDLPDEVAWLPSAPDVLALRRGALVCVLSTASEPVEVAVPGTSELLETTADGVVLADGVLTLPAATTAWLR
ncbi:MAG: hypothetical protein JWO60_2279 [Frankiales bacterium]|nr:hypothetical protein [Frankiales bacterium]